MQAIGGSFFSRSGRYVNNVSFLGAGDMSGVDLAGLVPRPLPPRNFLSGWEGPGYEARVDPTSSEYDVFKRTNAIPTCFRIKRLLSLPHHATPIFTCTY